MPLTDEERKETDRVCLILLGYQPGEWVVDNNTLWSGWRCEDAYGKRLMSPSHETGLVVPLIEALRKAGWEMGEIRWDVRGYRVTLERRSGPDADGGWWETMEEALAVAAARAVERSGEDG